MPWMRVLTVVGLYGRTSGVSPRGAGEPSARGAAGTGAMSTGILSVPVTPVTMSTKSPALMIVPTPETWSTWTAMAT